MKFKTTIRRSYDQEVIDHITCDLCRQLIADPEIYDVAETEVRMKTGWGSPDGGEGEETTVDICIKCFTETLIPLLKGLGTVPTVEKWDF